MPDGEYVEREWYDELQRERAFESSAWSGEFSEDEVDVEIEDYTYVEDFDDAEFARFVDDHLE